MSAERRVRVLVVDDEPLGRLRVEDLVRHEASAELVGSAADGAAAVEAIRTLRPDLVFLDVQMPGKTGLDVVREIGPDAMPATIFVTAYDQYAIQAFDVAAVDYLVKPFDDERFEQAFQRACRLLRLEGMAKLREQLVAVLEGTSVAPAGTRTPPVSILAAPAPGRYLDRMAVESHGRVQSLQMSDVEYIVASGPYARLQVGDHRWVIRSTMHDLETRLDPRMFMRVHRSIIVRLDLVEALVKSRRGEPRVQLKNGVRLRVSRSRRQALERWLGEKR
ncbi:MAG: LytR/AlgR family response regulator transcription factor [Gemmatimonadales bacterium]